MKTFKPYTLVAGIVLASVIAFFIYLSVAYRTEISQFDLTASVADASGISPDSHFTLTTTAPLTTQVIEKYVKIVPAINFSVKKALAQENTFEIIPKEPLQSNQVYLVQVDKGPIASRDFSWAYQVKAPFQMIVSIPRDKGVDVPTNTGIEIDFNRDTLLNPEKYIEITPAVPGRFEVVENKVRFIPKNPLNERTVYTVKIQKGLQAQGTVDTLVSDTVFQFETGDTYLSTPNRPSVSFSRIFNEFKPESDIVFAVNAYNTTSAETVVYRFNSAQEYTDVVQTMKGNVSWARYSYKKENLASLESKKVFSGTIPLEKGNYVSYLRLPQAFENGYYAVMITSGDSNGISLFQVNPAASFSAFAGKKTLIWLKDINSTKNTAGISITFNGKYMGQTGSDGVVVLDTPSELVRKSTDPYTYNTPRQFFMAKIPSGDLVIPAEDEYGNSNLITENDAQWEYISLNKNVYLPTDTLHFWAIQKPRQGDIHGEEIKVTLTTPYWRKDQQGIVTYAQTTTKVSEYNAITGEVSFKNLKPGTYDLAFSKGDEIVSKQTITVSAYIKPAYKLLVTPDKNAVFAGDAVTFKVTAQLFDGTPVPHTNLSYTGYNYSSDSYKGSFVTNEQGEGSFTITPTFTTTQYSYWPNYLGVSIQPTQAEEGQIQSHASVLVFGPHIHNTIQQTRENSRVDFTIKSRQIIIKDPLIGSPLWDTEGYLGNAVGGASTRVQVSEVVYKVTQVGTGYNPIQKTTYPINTYTTEYNILSSQEIIANQSGISQFSFNPEPKKVYRLVFTTEDDFGRSAEETRYVYGYPDYSVYGFQDESFQDSSYSLYDQNNTKKYKIGDKIHLKLQTQQGVVPPQSQGNYIFITSNNGELEYSIQDVPEYSSSFRSQDVPNIGVWPGWFASGRFHNSYVKNLSFDEDERRLSVSVTKDKKTYKPGENVSIDIQVTDKDKNPVKAEVNLSALDEAVFSIRPDERDIINDLYRDIYTQVMIRSSHMPPYGGGGAEKGGGDGDGSRSNIQEMAIFKTITTDSNGRAHIEFKLPENITSWRLTTQAVTKDLFAGKDVSFIPVTLPLFIDATLNTTYLAGDQLNLRLRAFGDMSHQGTLKYSVESPTLPFKKIELTGGSSVDVSLGALTAGKHSLTVRTSGWGFSDALTRPLEVLTSYFTKNTSDFYRGTEGLKIQNDALGYTTLTFNSLGRGSVYNKLKSLSYQWGVRLDQKGSQVIARNLLKSYFGEENKVPEFQAIKYQAYSGGLQLLPYSSEDLELSALGAHLFDDSVFDLSLLKKYLTNSLSDTKSDTSRTVRALYGLSAFSEPILVKIQKIKNDSSLTLKDKVFVALTLDAVGSKEEARAYYKEMIRPSIEMKSSYAYVGGLKDDETILTTTLVAVLTSNLAEEESSKLYAYVEKNYPRQTLNNFEQLLYVKSRVPRLSSDKVSFTYKAGSKEGYVSLDDGKSFNVTLSPQELSSLKLSNITGDLGVTASYEKTSSPESITQDKNLGLVRSYSLDYVSSTQFKEGDLVTVRLYPQFSPRALPGSYQVVDYLPSGLRPVDQESFMYYNNYASRIYPAEINNQRVTFVFNRDLKLPLFYYARVVSKGVYKAEPAILQSLESLDSMTISHEDSVTIK